MQPNDLSTSLTDVEYEELDHFLLSVDHEDAVLNLSEFDGFITAIVSGPEPIVPSIWMPALWGGENNAPVWDNVADYRFILGLMMRHINSTATTLLENPAEFEPMFMESTIDGITHWDVDEWCSGYEKGVALYPPTATFLPDMTEMLAPIRQFSDPDNLKSLEGRTLQEIRELQEQIAPAARDIHAFWLEMRTPYNVEGRTYTRPEPKIGRNDPCPCGSGTKFKKCCGVS